MDPTVEVALAAVRQASVLCRSVQSRIGPEVLQKKDRSPVTVADFGSQALVCRTLQEHFPGDPVVAEEDSAALRSAENEPVLRRVVEEVQACRAGAGADEICRWIDHGAAGRPTDRFWTLDPIDGTKGFLRRGQYAIALALIENGRVVLAAMACPNLSRRPEDNSDAGAVFTATEAGEALSWPLEGDGPPSPMACSRTIDTAAARFCESVESGHSSHDHSARVAQILGIASEPVRLDSQAKYAVVAGGEADIYLRLPTRPGYVERIWDHAAGSLVIAEAGGTVTDVHGNPLDFSRGAGLENNRGVVATNGLLHARVLQALKEIGI